MIFFQTLLFAQQSDTIPKSNPIFYFDIHFGIGRAEKIAFSTGASLNYQVSNNLFTARYAAMTRVDNWFLIFPTAGTTTTEFGVLYGKRFVDGGESYSFSAGIALVKTEKNFNNQPNSFSTYIGIPFEFNYMFFKANKEPFRIFYGIIPVGKPITFGQSVGFKLLGNISKNPFFGIGVTTSIGWHKKY